jgi:hypothetical protein
MGRVRQWLDAIQGDQLGGSRVSTPPLAPDATSGPFAWRLGVPAAQGCAAAAQGCAAAAQGFALPDPADSIVK